MRNGAPAPLSALFGGKLHAGEDDVPERPGRAVGTEARLAVALGEEDERIALDDAGRRIVDDRRARLENIDPRAAPPVGRERNANDARPAVVSTSKASQGLDAA